MKIQLMPSLQLLLSLSYQRKINKGVNLPFLLPSRVDRMTYRTSNIQKQITLAKNIS